MGLTHAFVSAKADGGDSTLVRPSNWNATHIGISEINRLPTGDVTVATGYGATIVGDCEIPSGFVLDLLDDSVLEIT